MSQGVHLRRYGVQTTIDFEVYEVDGVDLRTDWVPAQADCEIMKDEGVSTMCDNTATDEGSTYSIVLTATEMEAARLVLKVVDAAVKVFLDKVIIIETFGHASAQNEIGAWDVWEEILTGATHNTATSAGRRLRGIQEFQGYEGGAVWIDTVDGVAGTTLYENGTVENPVDSIADANTIANDALLNLKKFRILPGSTITFAAAQEGQEFEGSNWTLVLNGQSIANSHFSGAAVSGVSSGSGVDFHDCDIDTSTIGPGFFRDCGIKGTFTSAANGDYYFVKCFSEVAGAGTPAFDFSGEGAAVTINNRGWKGGAAYTLDSDCTLSHEVLAGGATTVTTGGAAVEIRGTTRNVAITSTAGAGETVQFVGVTGAITLAGANSTCILNCYGVATSVTDNTGGGGPAVVTNETVNYTQVNAIETDTQDIQNRIPAALTGDGNIKSDMLRINGSDTSADNLQKSAGVMVVGTVDWTANAATNTTLESDDITEATADHFNGRVIIFLDDDLIYSATDITDYELNGGRGKFTFTAVTSAPADNSTFIIV